MFFGARYGEDRRDACNQFVGDSGSFSRYFDLDKWAETLPFLIVPKASKSEKGDNNHPTVKPLKLMAYLITLGSREGDTILDPFAGTSTTGIAALLLKRNAVMIEIDPDSCDIGLARLQGYNYKTTQKED